MPRRRIYPESKRTRVDVVTSATSSSEPKGASAFHESVQQVRQRVLQAVDKGDFVRAIAILNRLITMYPTSAEDYNNRGLIHLWSGAQHKAFWDFNRAIALNPELPAAYNNRANYYAGQGAQARALADYERTIDLNPFHIRARINRAITLRSLDRYDEALEGLEEALLFRQMLGDIYAERGRTYHLRGDWNCAIADYRRALQCFSQKIHQAKSPGRSRQQQLTTWLNQLLPAG